MMAPNQYPCQFTCCAYATINVMLHPPLPWVGCRNTGYLTKSSVKFPSTGAKKLVKTSLCPHLDRGVSIGDLIYHNFWFSKLLLSKAG